MTKSPSFARRNAVACTVTALLLPAMSWAQTLPDAGSVRQQIEQQRSTPLPAQSESQFVPPPPMESTGGETLTVRQFKFAGNTLLTNERLESAVKDYIERPLDFAGLQNAAISVANAYRQDGWVVRAYLPQQEIENGVVTIQVIEARLGAVRVEGEATRVSSSRVKGIVEAVQEPGEPLSADALDRSLLLINDLPGVAATGRLGPGVRQAETDLMLAVEDGPLVDGSLSVDDAGSRFTGAARVIGTASLNDRLGIGDRADVLLLHSKGNDYVRLGYSLPVGHAGWRVGANASHLDYDIVTREFEALDAHGASNTVGIEASYPLLRARMKNLYFAFRGDHNNFDNKSAGQTTTDYSVQSATVSLYGNLFDQYRGGGVSTASLSFTQGEVDLSGSPNELADSMTTRTDGSYHKILLSASRLQVLNERFSLFGSLQGQFASKNLDSSEKMYLGGSQGIRAYPEDEAGGSEGMMMTLEARTKVASSINLTGFVDWGRVRVNRENDFPGAAVRNDLTLKGIGVSAGWVASFGLNLKATYARRLGSNPNPTPSGDDQDGSLVKNRIWLQATMPF